MKTNQTKNKDTKSHKQQAIRDLEFLFCEAEASMGVKSTYSAFIYACKFSTKHQEEVDIQSFSTMSSNTTTAYDIIAAAGKNRKVLKNYQQLSSKHKIILEAYYEERQYSSPDLKGFGHGVGLIPYTSIGKEFNKLLIMYPSKTFNKEFAQSKLKLQREVEKLYNDAVDAYAKILKNKGTK